MQTLGKQCVQQTASGELLLLNFVRLFVRRLVRLFACLFACSSVCSLVRQRKSFRLKSFHENFHIYTNFSLIYRWQSLADKIASFLHAELAPELTPEMAEKHGQIRASLFERFQ